MATRFKSRVEVPLGPAEPLPLFSEPEPDPAGIFANRRLSARQKAELIVSWAKVPEIYRASFPDLPRVSWELCTRLLEELRRRELEDYRRRGGVDELGLPTPIFDLRPWINKARKRAELERPACEPSSDASTRQGLRREARKEAHDAIRSSAAEPHHTSCCIPSLEPLETSSTTSTAEIAAKLEEFSGSRQPYDVDKKRAGRLTWLRKKADRVVAAFSSVSDPEMLKRADRVKSCATMYGVKVSRSSGEKVGSIVYRCRDRFCPTCAYFRAREVRQIVREATRELLDVWPDMRFAMLTLTLKNVPVDAVDVAFDQMAAGLKRLYELQDWPALGYVRFAELTRGRDGSAHPHFHILLALPASYFTDRGSDATYLPQKRWAELWKQSLRVDYEPILDVRVIKPTLRTMRRCQELGIPKEQWQTEAIVDAMAEIAKYPLKYDARMLEDSEWFLMACRELKGVRAFQPGGVFLPTCRAAKKARDVEKRTRSQSEAQDILIFWYRWSGELQAYLRCNNDHSDLETKIYFARLYGVTTRGGP